MQAEFFAPHWLGRAPLLERLSPVLARIAPQASAEALVAYWFENDPASTPTSSPPWSGCTKR